MLSSTTQTAQTLCSSVHGRASRCADCVHQTQRSRSGTSGAVHPTMKIHMLVLTAVLASATSALADDTDVTRVRFTSTATLAQTVNAACALRGVSSIGGRARSFDVHIGNRRCS